MIACTPLSRPVRRCLKQPVAHAASVPGADAYRKHFPASAHLWLLLWHGLSASPSLRQTHAAAAADPHLWAGLGLPPLGISRSQLARSSTSRPLACAEQLLAELRAALPARTVPDTVWGPVTLIDSSFVALSAQLAPWSQHGRHTAGVRVHTGSDLAQTIPEHLTVSLADTHDLAAFRARDWTELRGWTVVVDRGYYSHRTFAALLAAGVSWLCPLHAQARVVVLTDLPVGADPTPAGDVIVADQRVTLGSPHNRAGAVVPAVRLVTSRNRAGQLHRLVTDRVDLSATEVVTLSRQRWQIELFFRWLKHHLGILQPLGYSRHAIRLTLLLAAIVAVLLVLLAAQRPPHISDIAGVRALGTALFIALLNSG